MVDIKNSDKPILLVDIDDFLVFSSDKLQEIVDKRTNFKTDVLHMLEQLSRNCRYLVDEVKKECEKAREEKRKPNLERFLIFKNFSCNEEELYTKPIDCAKYYLTISEKFKNQFLEERDTFLETDNMTKGGQRTFDYIKELAELNRYDECIINNKEAFHLINEFCLNEAKSLIEEAKKKNTDGKLTIPLYGALVSMDTNDIIKKNSIHTSKEETLYEKPLEKLNNCIALEDRIDDIVTNGHLFFKPSEAIVDYESIHSIENVNWDAVALVRELINSGAFAGVYFSTHHNGGREERAKIRLMNRILPEANGFIGQRFHATEHNVARRDRSSKIERAAQYLGVSPSRLVLLDDSKANCADCQKNGGVAILYKPETDSEMINGRIEETGFDRILNLRGMMAFNLIIAACLAQKQKIMIRK